jgi:hypothetical protein
MSNGLLRPPPPPTIMPQNKIGSGRVFLFTMYRINTLKCTYRIEPEYRGQCCKIVKTFEG